MTTETSTISSVYAARADLPEQDLLPSRIGRYIPIRRIGGGGMGLVYEADDPSLGRRVAVKVLHRTYEGGEEERSRRRRLLREAQAMARLSHPNVLPVFDVGESGTDVFLAMELVSGRSLAEWLAVGGHSWRAIVAVFASAGRGLAAAHAAGVVHRDFKPGNVLVGDEGHVRVVDFGLARNQAGGDSVESNRELPPPAPPESSLPADEAGRHAPGGLWRPLTHAGAVMGTPAYMSPEQRRGTRADACSDQYSFCVSLWEALGGQLALLMPEPPTAIAVPGGPRGPRRLRRALLKGLRLDPRERHESMTELLRELDRLLHRRRRWVSAAAALAAVGIVAGLALAAGSDDLGQLCRGADRRLEGVWDEGAQRGLRNGFMATGSPAAGADAGRVIGRLDAYARSWVAMRTEACEATHVYGEQSEGLLDLRMQCLDRRLSQLHALVAVLGDGSAPTAGALDAVWRLEPLEVCADPDALAQAFPVPAEPERRERVIDLRARLDRAAALLKAGRYTAARDLAGEVVADADRLAYPPLQAEALLLDGVILDQAEQPEDAERVLRAAALAAAEAEDDGRLATAWVELVWVLGMSLARHDEALQLAELAGTAVIRARSQQIRGLLENHRGAVLSALGRYREAEQSFGRAVQLRQAVLGPSHPDTASSLANVASTLVSQGKFEDARQMHERALALRRAALGDEHPIVAKSLTNLGRVAALEGNLKEAIRLEESALRIREKVLGPEHTDVGISLNNLGAHAAAMGDHAGAVARLERALVVFTATLPPDHPYAAQVLSGLGESYVHLGRAAEAVAPLERALAIQEKQDDPVQLGNAEYALATAVDAALRDRGRARVLMSRARDHYAQAGKAPEAEKFHAMATDWLQQHARR